MASQGFYTTGLLRMLTDLDITATTLKVMLLKTTSAWNPDDDSVNASLTAAELSATNYTGGYGGGGRKTATVTAQSNDTDNRVDCTCADLTWTSLGGASNDTIGGCALIYEAGGSDATAIPIVFWDVTDLPTNGGDVVLDFPTLGAGGAMRISVGSP